MARTEHEKRDVENQVEKLVCNLSSAEQNLSNLQNDKKAGEEAHAKTTEELRKVKAEVDQLTKAKRQLEEVNVLAKHAMSVCLAFTYKPKWAASVSV